MLIDTHCHLDFPEFDADREEVVRRAADAGVGTIINVASSLKASRQAVALAARFPGVYASVGIHPHDAQDCDEAAFAEVRSLAREPKVVAVGEVGLDFYRNLSPPKEQEGVFERFIALAREAKLPLIVHTRMAHERSFEMLEAGKASDLPGVVIHCFSGDAAFLTRCLDAGFFVSFTCNVTYKKAETLRGVLARVPLDRLFLETDAPFLAPEGKRGTRNEPAALPVLAELVARLKGVDTETVCARTTQNAREFFRLSA
ncbi:MAG: TatD family hydrolase [Deltaproteobacteria bacterium]